MTQDMKALAAYLRNPPDGGNRYWGGNYSRKRAAEAATVIETLLAEREATQVHEGGEVDWQSLPSGVTPKVARKAYEHFQHTAEFPCSASAMREAIEVADRLRAHEGGDTVDVPRDDLRQLLAAVEKHWNAEMAKGRKRWNEDSLMAKWIINLRAALQTRSKP